MSRSFKKFPGYTDYSRGYTKWSKRQASKKVRRSFDVPSGKAYRKYYDPWNIRDWVCIYFKESDYNRNRFSIDSWKENLPTNEDKYKSRMK